MSCRLLEPGVVMQSRAEVVSLSSSWNLPLGGEADDTQIIKMISGSDECLEDNRQKLWEHAGRSNSR